MREGERPSDRAAVTVASYVLLKRTLWAVRFTFATRQPASIHARA